MSKEKSTAQESAGAVVSLREFNQVLSILFATIRGKLTLTQAEQHLESVITGVNAG